MSSSSPLFSRSLGVIADCQLRLAQHTVSERGREELLQLAQFVSSAYIDEQNVAVTFAEDSGYCISSASAPDAVLDSIATILAQISNHEVSYIRSDSQIEVRTPIGVPVIIQNLPSQLGIQHSIAQRLFETFVGRQHNTDAQPDVVLSDAHDRKLRAFGDYAVKRRDSGTPELVVQHDFTLLANREFLALMQELQETHGTFFLRCEPSFASSCSAARELIGHHAAWELTEEDNTLVLKVLKASRLSQTLISEAASCIEARAHIPVRVEYHKSPFIRLLPPTVESSDVASTMSAASYLPATLSGSAHNTNRVTCIIPFEKCDARILRFITSHISSGSNFVGVATGHTPTALSLSEFKDAVHALADKLCIPRARFSTAKGAINAIHLPSLTDVPHVEALLTCTSYINSLSALCSTPVQVQRNLAGSEVFAFFARFVGHTTDWSFITRDTLTEVRTRSPEKFTSEVTAAFRTIFGTDLRITRDPEPEHGEFLLAPREAESRVLNRQFFPDELASIFPRGFGNPPAMIQQGNRLLVYSMTKNLPSAYLSSVTSDLYGLGVPVVLRQDAKAHLVTEVSTLQDIIVRSLPRGSYLRTIVDSDDTFRIEISGSSKDHVHVRAVLKEIALCSAKKLSLVWRKASPELLTAWELCGSENDKRFLGLAVDHENCFMDSRTLVDTFCNLFHYQQELPRSISEIEQNRAGKEVDLSHVECISIDGDGTYFCEDIFSVEQMPGGGYRIGVHIIAGSKLIPYGSVADIMARRRGNSSLVKLDGREFRGRLFSHDLQTLFHLDKTAKTTFSLTFETNDHYTIHPDSYHLRLARVRNSRQLSFSEADDVMLNRDATHEPGGETLRLLERFVRKQNERGCGFADRSTPVFAMDITHFLVGLFNWYADSLLRESGIALPLHNSSGVERYDTKFTGPARDYRALLAQRQLERFLRRQHPMSSVEIAEHEAHIGTGAEASLAFQLLSIVESFRKSDQTRRVALLPNGQCGWK